MEPNPPVRGSPPGDHAASLAASAALHRSNSAVLLVDVASATLPCCRCHRITIHDSCKGLQDEDARRRVADIAEDVAPAARAEEEPAGPEDERRGLAFDLDAELAAQDVEGFILAAVGM